MTPSLRPVLPLFDFTTLRRANRIRLRPRHVFHVQRFLYHARKSEKEEERRLRRLYLSQRSVPLWSKIWWSTRRLPFVPIRLIPLAVSCLYRYWQRWNLPMVKISTGFNSHAGWFLSDFRSGCIGLLNESMHPWGLVSLYLGSSNEPTIPAAPAPVYASYAYIDRQDIRRSDVVLAIPPKRYDKGNLVCKRVAALGGERIRVTRYSPGKIPHKIVHVRISSVISLLSSVFTYGHYRYRSDTAFCLGITLQTLLTQGHTVRCRLNPFWLNCNGDWA